MWRITTGMWHELVYVFKGCWGLLHMAEHTRRTVEVGSQLGEKLLKDKREMVAISTGDGAVKMDVWKTTSRPILEGRVLRSANGLTEESKEKKSKQGWIPVPFTGKDKEEATLKNRRFALDVLSWRNLKGNLKMAVSETAVAGRRSGLGTEFWGAIIMIQKGMQFDDVSGNRQN